MSGLNLVTTSSSFGEIEKVINNNSILENEDDTPRLIEDDGDKLEEKIITRISRSRSFAPAIIKKHTKKSKLPTEKILKYEEHIGYSTILIETTSLTVPSIKHNAYALYYNGFIYPIITIKSSKVIVNSGKVSIELFICAPVLKPEHKPNKNNHPKIKTLPKLKSGVKGFILSKEVINNTSKLNGADGCIFRDCRIDISASDVYGQMKKVSFKRCYFENCTIIGDMVNVAFKHCYFGSTTVKTNQSNILMQSSYLSGDMSIELSSITMDSCTLHNSKLLVGSSDVKIQNSTNITRFSELASISSNLCIMESNLGSTMHVVSSQLYIDKSVITSDKESLIINSSSCIMGSEMESIALSPCLKFDGGQVRMVDVSAKAHELQKEPFWTFLRSTVQLQNIKLVKKLGVAMIVDFSTMYVRNIKVDSPIMIIKAFNSHLHLTHCVVVKYDKYLSSKALSNLESQIAIEEKKISPRHNQRKKSYIKRLGNRSKKDKSNNNKEDEPSQSKSFDIDYNQSPKTGIVFEADEMISDKVFMDCELCTLCIVKCSFRGICKISNSNMYTLSTKIGQLNACDRSFGKFSFISPYIIRCDDEVIKCKDKMGDSKNKILKKNGTSYTYNTCMMVFEHFD